MTHFDLLAQVHIACCYHFGWAFCRSFAPFFPFRSSSFFVCVYYCCCWCSLFIFISNSQPANQSVSKPFISIWTSLKFCSQLIIQLQIVSLSVCGKYTFGTGKYSIHYWETLATLAGKWTFSTWVGLIDTQRKKSEQQPQPKKCWVYPRDRQLATRRRQNKKKLLENSTPISSTSSSSHK